VAIVAEYRHRSGEVLDSKGCVETLTKAPAGYVAKLDAAAKSALTKPSDKNK